MIFKKEISEKEQRTTQVSILTGFLFIAYFFQVWWLVVAMGMLGLVFLFSKKLTTWFLNGWLSLAFLLGWVNSRLLLSLVYFLILLPLAYLSRLRRKDPLMLHRPSETNSLFKVRNHTYSKSDFEKIW